MKSPAQRSDRRTRFSLAALFETVAAAALFAAMTAQHGLAFASLIAFVALLLIAGATFVANQKNLASFWRTLIDVGLVVLILNILVLQMLPSTYRTTNGWHPQCSNNLRQLGLAFHEYHDVHGHFPPPYLADANGKPMHSWRVLILPFLELDNIYKAYNFNEPWNGPNNSKLSAAMPRVFRCPQDKQLPPGMTSYFCIVGSGRMPEGRANQRRGDFTDELSILLVESHTARVNWLEPRELTVDEVLGRSGATSAPTASANHRSQTALWQSGAYFHCACHDASVHRIATDIAPDLLKPMLTIAGGEKLDLSEIESLTYRVRPAFFSNALVTVLTIAYVFVAVVRRFRQARRGKKHVGTMNGTADSLARRSRNQYKRRRSNGRVSGS